MKSKLKIIGLALIVFGIMFLSLVVWFYTLMGILFQFGLIGGGARYVLPWILGGVAITLLVVCQVTIIHKGKRNKLFSWWWVNYPRVILYYSASLVFLGSFKNDVIYTNQELQNLVVLEWNIWAITSALFVVWVKKIAAYFEKKKPEIAQEQKPIEQYISITQRGIFYLTASVSFNSVWLFAIELILLVFATAGVYLVKEDINIVTQTLVIAAFFMDVTPLMSLFWDLLRVFKEKRKSLLDGTRVTLKEAESADQFNQSAIETVKVVERIKKSSAFTDEQKTEMVQKLISEVLGMDNDEL